MEDVYWWHVLAALDTWSAAAGRYRDLDALRGKPATADPAWTSWEEAERRAVEESGGWAALSGERLKASRLRVLQSVMCWWHTLYRCWQHGLLGADGKTFSSTLSPQNLHLDAAVANLVSGR